MNQIKFFILLLLSTMVLGNLVSQERYLKLDSLLNARSQEQRFSGIVFVAEGNEIMYTNAFGYADYARKIPLNLSTQFDLSSGSKLFTAVAIAQLIDQNKLSFNTKIKEFFPELINAKNINIHQLMTHSSGLGHFQIVKGFSYQNITSCIDVLPFIKTEPLLFEPGDSVYYATSNLLILGAIVEKISDLTFPEYVKENIISKLDLKRTTFDTYFQVQDYAGRDGRFAKGYIKNEKEQISEKNRYKDEQALVVLSAGGMWSSAIDLFEFDKALFSGQLFDEKLLTPMTEHHVFTGWEGTYFGYVFNIINVNSNKEGAGHAGNSSGHHSFNFRYENRETTLIILTNYGFVDIFELAHGQIEPILFDD
ncbi:serine hydrolase domain-containing protein [Ekhidna sp.]|uniref:serine hydrolase domain-containing protein n=1 Tax=Ekhidna sp. TaxID=2608089 RepID=UPI003B505C1B